MRLQEYGQRWILPHEKIMTRPLEDRVHLMRKTETQFEYIWSIYHDKAYEEMVDIPFSSEWKRLDVNILNTLILQRIIGLTEGELSAHFYPKPLSGLVFYSMGNARSGAGR